MEAPAAWVASLETTNLPSAVRLYVDALGFPELAARSPCSLAAVLEHFDLGSGFSEQKGLQNQAIWLLQETRICWWLERSSYWVKVVWEVVWCAPWWVERQLWQAKRGVEDADPAWQYRKAVSLLQAAAAVLEPEAELSAPGLSLAHGVAVFAVAAEVVQRAGSAGV